MAITEPNITHTTHEVFHVEGFPDNCVHGDFKSALDEWLEEELRGTDFDPRDAEASFVQCAVELHELLDIYIRKLNEYINREEL